MILANVYASGAAPAVFDIGKNVYNIGRSKDNHDYNVMQKPPIASLGNWQGCFGGGWPLDCDIDAFAKVSLAQIAILVRSL